MGGKGSLAESSVDLVELARETVRVCSLGQVTKTLFEVGGVSEEYVAS